MAKKETYVSFTESGAFGSTPYVYYNTLQTTHPNLYRSVYSGVKDIADISNEENDYLTIVSNRLRAMASAEAKKEVAALQRGFGLTNLSIDLDNYNLEAGKIIMEDFNTVLNFKDVYERNLARIKAQSGQITYATSLGSQIKSMFNQAAQHTGELYPIIEEFIYRYVNGNNPSFEQLKEDILNAILLKMMSSATFTGGKDTPFEEMAAELEKFPKWKDELLKAIWDNYKLESVLESIKESLRTTIDANKILGKAQSKVSEVITGKLGSGNTAQLGYMGEMLSNVAAGLKLDIAGNDGLLSMNIHGVANTGATGIKSDNTFTIGINVDEITNIIESVSGTNREKNLQKAELVQQHLGNLEEGFLIYSNVKNYSVGKNFEGFSSGSDISLRTFTTLLKAAYVKSSQLTQAIMQLIPGAIGAGEIDNNVSTLIANEIALFLFDDFEVIGKETGGAQTIHLLDLSGTYVPLSIFLQLYADAVGIGNGANLVKVQIHHPI
jgi:hypothetical protein